MERFLGMDIFIFDVDLRQQMATRMEHMISRQEVGRMGT
jgi:hypothetical protein